MPPAGPALFARYAFPPNELGYCGPAGPQPPHVDQLAVHAREFDGAWPYLNAIADSAGLADPLDADVVRNYWVGGPLLGRVDPAELLVRLRAAFAGQVTGLLDELPDATGISPHHSFHVLVVYPWIRFLDRDPVTPLRILQSCRIRWGTVVSVDGEHAVIASRPLTFDRRLALGDAVAERVQWSKGGIVLAAPPAPGELVAAHWGWVCGTLTAADAAALDAATQSTLDLVNATR